MRGTHYFGGVILLLLLLIAAPARAQSAADCANLMKFGVYDKYRTFTTESQYKQIKEFFLNNTFSSKQQAQDKAAELGLNIDGVLGLSFGGTSSASNFEQWRQLVVNSSYQEAISAGLSATAIETISGKMTELVGRCLSQTGVHTYVIPAADNQNFTVTVDFVSSSSEHPYTTGTLTLTPSSVASQCSPGNILGQSMQIGLQGVSLSCRRLATDTVTVLVNAQDGGTRTFTYDAYVVPPPSIQFGASRNPINRGDTSTLSWEVRNALRVAMPELGPVPATGSRDVAPAETKEYVLNVTSLDGKPLTASKTITVIQPPPPPPRLTGARVFFRTTDDDKDDDTNVSVNVTCGGSTVAAVSGTFGKWPDNTDNGPFNMNVLTPLPKPEAVGCRAHMVEGPHGHDEWHFNWWVELIFSDSSTIRHDGSGNVDYDRPDAYINF